MTTKALASRTEIVTTGAANVATDSPRGRAVTWYEFPLDASVTTLYLAPADGFTGTATVQFVTYLPTELGVNADGLTYGVSGSSRGEPDLIAVLAETASGDVVEAYVFTDELSASSPDHPGLPSSPAEALRWREEIQAKYPDGWDLPAYESDGTTRVGTFHVGG